MAFARLGISLSVFSVLLQSCNSKWVRFFPLTWIQLKIEILNEELLEGGQTKNGMAFESAC
jgi:hypothetical protein